MKHVLLISILCISTLLLAQTATHKNNLSIGFGKQGYNGDLGNAWFKLDEEWYGIGTLSYSRYLNRSFDFMGSITHGDFGHCREDDESQYRIDGSEVLNMLSRLTSVVVSAKYKLANGYLLTENARLAPYVFAGVGFNNVGNYLWPNKSRVNPGNYGSYHSGFGLRYRIRERLHFTYQMGFGYFTSDNMDFRSVGRNDMVMQNTIQLGWNF